jgi:protein ImuB
MMHVDGARRLTAVDVAAAAEGVRAGQTATDATALFGGLRIVDADPAEDLRVLTRIADWFARFSPAVAVDPPDGLLLDIEGCAHLWGGEAKMLQTIIMRLRADDIPAEAAIADTFGAAWALARHAPGAIIAGDATRALSPLPLAGLRIDEATQMRLMRLGLRTIGDVARLPRTGLRKRFGDALLVRLDHALGRESEAIAFRQTPPAWRERSVFPDGLVTAESLAAALDGLAARLCARLKTRALGARFFEARFHRLDGDMARRGVRLALPARDPRHLMKLFAPKLETLDPGFGVEAIVLAAYAVAPLEAMQTDLAGDAQTVARADLAPFVDRLVNRLGADRVWRPAPFGSHLPERAVRPAAPLAAVAPFPAQHLRPLRLFTHPEPIEVVAALPDAPPRLFHWRGRAHAVAAAEGPERIAAEWWRKSWDAVSADDVRDYYRVEDKEGFRFWLFRDGLYGGEAAPRWWMHGLFA